MIVANSLRTAGAGFGTDTNIVTVITKDGAEELALMSKDQVAHELLNRILPQSTKNRDFPIKKPLFPATLALVKDSYV